MPPRVETKTFFSFSQKAKIKKMSKFRENFCFGKIIAKSFRFRENFCFREKLYSEH
jgi:hypothetical protein